MKSEIFLLSRPMCSDCAKLKRYLDAHKIAYEEKDCSKGPGLAWQRQEDYWPQWYPALVVDGRLYEHAALFAEDGQLLDLKEILK